MLITVETEKEGKVTIDLPYEEDEGLTWVELTRNFSNALKALGFIPHKLDKFLDEQEY